MSQAAPVSPFGKGAYPGAGAQDATPSTARPAPAALQHQQLQQQPQQQQWQRRSHPHQQPQSHHQSALPAASSSYTRPQHNHVQMQQQPLGQYASQRAGSNQPSMQHSRQQLPSQPSMYSGPRPGAVSSAPVGRVSQAAAAALGMFSCSSKHPCNRALHAVLCSAAYIVCQMGPHRIGMHLLHCGSNNRRSGAARLQDIL